MPGKKVTVWTVIFSIARRTAVLNVKNIPGIRRQAKVEGDDLA
jgi:hypothetical protein